MKVVNKKVYHDYFIRETLEAGVVLTGPEVRSVKSSRIQLEGSYVKHVDGELVLINAVIPPYQFASQPHYDQKRTRKLLLRKKQIITLSTKIAQDRLTLVPVSCYTTRGLVKLEIGLAKRKQSFDKREDIRKRDLERETSRSLRRK